MKSGLVLVLVALLFVVAFTKKASKEDLVVNFRNCVKACRKEKNSFAFCVSFCSPQKGKPVKPQKVESQKKVAEEPTRRTKSVNKNDPLYKQIFGDQPEEEQVQSDQAVPPQSKELWQKYRSVLLDFFRQGDGNAMPGLQLVPQPFPADWDIQAEILNQLCDRVPKWAPTYEPSRHYFTSEYGEWLMNIKIPNDKPFDPNQFREIDQQLRNAEDSINDAEIRCQERYDLRYGKRSPTFGQPPTFEAYSSRFCADIDRANKVYDMLLADYELQQRAAFGEHFGLKRAITKWSQASRSSFKFLSLGSMARFVEAAKDNRTNTFEIKMTSKTTVTTEKTFQMSVGVGFKYQDFFSVEANFGKQEYKFNTRTDELQLIVGALGYKYFPITPDRSWFSPEVFNKYRDYPLKQQKNYFGIEGTMPLFPKAFIIVVGPRITMLVSADDASKIEKMNTFGIKLNIGGFNFDFAKNSTMKTTKESNNLFKITIEGNSYEPQVLAVDNELLAPGYLPKPRL